MSVHHEIRLRRFVFQRTTDVSGTSGTGIVAEGVQFTDGTVAVRWRSFIASHVIYPNAQAAEAIHSHGGATKMVWLDEVPA
jgi:hypothetical protein